MNDKKQALDKALNVIREAFMEPDRCGTSHIRHDLADHTFRVETWANVFTTFGYNPPKKAPRTGSIVEVWDDDEDCRQIAYSCGELSKSGWLYADEEYKHCHEASNSAAWENWRVIKEVGK